MINMEIMVGMDFVNGESSESFNSCFNAEKDEFCTDFFTCSASQSD